MRSLVFFGGLPLLWSFFLLADADANADARLRSENPVARFSWSLDPCPILLVRLLSALAHIESKKDVMIGRFVSVYPSMYVCPRYWARVAYLKIFDAVDLSCRQCVDTTKQLVADLYLSRAFALRPL